MKFAVVLLVLALCILGGESRRHRGGRGHHRGRGRGQRQHPCHIEDTAGNPIPGAVDRPCPDGSACTDGPRDWRLRDRTNAAAFFCATTSPQEPDEEEGGGNGAE